MPTFYDIARKTRNQLPYMQEYGGGIGTGRSTPPTGMGQHMIEADYFTPDLSNEQYWYENADPESRYNSFADAIGATGGDPDMERKVAFMNHQEAQKKQQQRQAIAMKVLQEQRMREKNRLQYLNAQENRQAQQARYDETTRRTEEDEVKRRLNAAIWKSGVADPQNKSSYLSQYKGSPQELTALSLSIDNAAQGRAEDQERRNAPIFRSAFDAIKKGEKTALGDYNLNKGMFLPYQVADLERAATRRDALADDNSKVANLNIKTMARAEADIRQELDKTQNEDDPKSKKLYQFNNKSQKIWDAKGGDKRNNTWRPGEKWEFKLDIKNYSIAARNAAKSDLQKKVKYYYDTIDDTWRGGQWQTIEKDPKTGEWINLWEEGRIDPKTGKVATGGQRFRGNVFSTGAGSGSVSDSEVLRAQAAQREARRQAFIEAQQQRAIDKQANIDDIQADSETHRRLREEYKEANMTDEDRAARYEQRLAEEQRVAEYTSGVEARRKAEELSQAKFRLDNPDHPATQRVYQSDPNLYKRDLSLVDVEDVFSDRMQDDDEWFGTTAATATSVDPTVVTQDDFDEWFGTTAATGSTNMPPVVAAESRTNTLPAAVTGVTTNTVAAPAQQVDNSTGVSVPVFRELVNSKAEELIREWMDMNPDVVPSEADIDFLRATAIGEIRKQGYKRN